MPTLPKRLCPLHRIIHADGCPKCAVRRKASKNRPGDPFYCSAEWKAVRDRGRFIQPDSSLELLGELNDLSSPISAFIRDRCDVDPDLTVPVDSLYSEWRRWCEASGKMRPTDKAGFGRDLSALLPSVRKSRPRAEDGERTYVYEGLAIKF